VTHREAPGRVFSAGWVSPRKNTLGLVQAFAQVARTRPAASLRIAGEQNDPAYAEAVRHAIRDLGLLERVTLLGRIGPQAIREELAQASVFALPSRQENAPMAIAEALAVGVPVVSSNRCGMPHMVKEGETGFLVDPEDCDALARRIAEILDDADLRARMSSAARRTAEARFHPDAIARKTVDVYRRLVQGAPPP
jgi:glycosyltransferase involved in cell wall biosynthesis